MLGFKKFFALRSSPFSLKLIGKTDSAPEKTVFDLESLDLADGLVFREQRKYVLCGSLRLELPKLKIRNLEFGELKVQ